MIVQLCKVCQEEKELNEVNFYRNKNKKHGFESQCKDCRRISDKKKYEHRKHKISEQKKKYYQRKKEKIRNYQRNYYHANAEKCKETSKIWDCEHPEQRRIINERSRTLKHGGKSDLSKKEWEDTLDFFDRSCAYCGMTELEHFETFNERLHHEHIVSVDKGGAYAKSNVVPACRSCNCSKAGHDFETWYRDFKHYNPIRESKILRHMRA
ncbi:HNH endonuclease [Streptococcus sp. ZJ93]|uniref:HNH endonuclease n=1 Tax=Streptococcus handemini TaxID=3161188 RepID=UPI0034D68C6D